MPKSRSLRDLIEAIQPRQPPAVVGSAAGDLPSAPAAPAMGPAPTTLRRIFAGTDTGKKLLSSLEGDKVGEDVSVNKIDPGGLSGSGHQEFATGEEPGWFKKMLASFMTGGF